jgi:hypothetical protein
MALQLLCLDSITSTEDLLQCLHVTANSTVAGTIFTRLSTEMTKEELEKYYQKHFIFPPDGPLKMISFYKYNELLVKDFNNVFEYLLEITTEKDLLDSLIWLDGSLQLEICLQLRARKSKVSFDEFMHQLNYGDPNGLYLLLKFSSLNENDLIQMLYHCIRYNKKIELIKEIDSKIMSTNLVVDDLLKEIYNGMYYDFSHVMFYIEHEIFTAWLGPQIIRDKIEFFYHQSIGRTNYLNVEFLKALQRIW